MLLQKLQQWLVLPPSFCRNCNKKNLIVGFRKTSIGWWWWWRGLFGWGVEGYIQWNLIGIVGLWGFILFEQMFPRLVNSVRPPALDADSLWVGPKHRCTSPSHHPHSPCPSLIPSAIDSAWCFCWLGCLGCLCITKVVLILAKRRKSADC